MSLLTGMRQGEIMGLRWKDIDFERNIIYIKQTLTQAAEIKIGAKTHQVYDQFTYQTNSSMN